MSRVTLLAFSSLAVLAVVAGTALGLWYGRSNPPNAPEIGGIFLAQPRPVAPFELVDGSGQPLTREDFLGRWSFLYFGYTFCPDVCPTTLVELDRVQQALAAEGLDGDNAYWFISVDPKRDTPDQLARYTSYFNAKFQGATGERETLDQLSRQFGVIYQIHEPEPGKEYYLVDHSSTLLLIDPQARLHAVLTPPHSPDQIVEDYRKVRAYYQDHSGQPAI